MRNGYFEKVAASAAVAIGVGVFAYVWSMDNTVVQHSEAIKALERSTSDVYTQARATRDRADLQSAIDDAVAEGRERNQKSVTLAAGWHNEDDERLDALSERLAHMEAHVETATRCECGGR